VRGKEKGPLRKRRKQVRSISEKPRGRGKEKGT
jgi:hypothetical protein